MSNPCKKFYTFVLFLFSLQILPVHASTLNDFKIESDHIQGHRAGILFSYDILFDNPSEESVDSFSICVRIKKNTDCQLYARFQGENSKHVEHFFPYGSIASQSGTQSFSIFLDKLIFGRQGQDSAQKTQPKTPLYEATLPVPNLYRVTYEIKSLTFLKPLPLLKDPQGQSLSTVRLTVTSPLYEGGDESQYNVYSCTPKFCTLNLKAKNGIVSAKDKLFFSFDNTVQDVMHKNIVSDVVNGFFSKTENLLQFTIQLEDKDSKTEIDLSTFNNDNIKFEQSTLTLTPVL